MLHDAGLKQTSLQSKELCKGMRLHHFSINYHQLWQASSMSSTVCCRCNSHGCLCGLPVSLRPFPPLLTYTLVQVLFKVYESPELQPYLDAANAEKEASST